MSRGFRALAGTVLVIALAVVATPAAQAGPWSTPQALPGGHHEQLFTDGNGGGIYLYVDGTQDCWRLHIFRRSSTPDAWSPAPSPSECIKTSNAIGHWGPNGRVLLSYAVAKDAGNPEGPWVLRLYPLASPTAPLPAPVTWEPPASMPLVPGNALVDNGDIAYRSIASLDDSGTLHVFWSTPVARASGFDQSGVGWSHLAGGTWAEPVLLPGQTTWDLDVSNHSLAAVPDGQPGELVFLAGDAEFANQRTKHLVTVAGGKAPSEQTIEFPGPSGQTHITPLLGGEAGVHFLAVVGTPMSMAEPFGNRQLLEVDAPSNQPPVMRSPGPYTLGSQELTVLPNGEAVAAWVNMANPGDPSYTYRLHVSRRTASGPFGSPQVFTAGESLSISQPELDTDAQGRVLLTYTDSDPEQEFVLKAAVAEPGQPFPAPVTLPYGRRDGACQRNQIGGVIDDFGRVTVLTREVNAVTPIPERNFSFTAQLPLESADNSRRRGQSRCSAPRVRKAVEVRRLSRKRWPARAKRIGLELTFTRAVEVKDRGARLLYRDDGKRKAIKIGPRRIETKSANGGREIVLEIVLPHRKGVRFTSPTRAATVQFKLRVAGRDEDCGETLLIRKVVSVSKRSGHRGR